jgi:hypothetical protein
MKSKLFYLAILSILFSNKLISQTLVPFLKKNGQYVYVDSATMKPITEGGGQYTVCDKFTIIFNNSNYENKKYKRDDRSFIFQEIQGDDKYDAFAIKRNTWKENLEKKIDKLCKSSFNTILGDDSSMLVAMTKETEFGYVFGYVNSKGEKITNFIYDDALPFSEGLALVEKKGSGHFFINKTGKIVLSDKNKPYTFSGSFHDGLAKVTKRYINKDACDYKKSIWGSDHMHEKYDLYGCYHLSDGFIDKSGKLKFIPSCEPKKGGRNGFNYASDFDNGFAVVSVDNSPPTINDGPFGMIDKTGKLILNIKYNHISKFFNGFAHFEVNGKQAFVNKYGKIVFRQKPSAFVKFEDYCKIANCNITHDILNKNNSFWDQHENQGRQSSLNQFFNGYAIVRDINGGWGVINENGKWIINPLYYTLYDYGYGFFIADIYNFYSKFFYTDREGREYREK